MPKFLYTIILAAGVAWFFTAQMFFHTNPDSTAVILKFLALLGLALTLSVSILIYVALSKRNPGFTNLRFLYRKAFKWGVFVGSFVCIFLGLRAFDLNSTFNTILLGIVYAMIFLQFRRSR